MSIFDGLKSFFGTKSVTAKAYPSVEYKDFSITPNPQAEGAQYRVRGLIHRGEQVHRFIRADLLTSADQCADETVRKAKLMIDQLGDDVFK